MNNQTFEKEKATFFKKKKEIILCPAENIKMY